MSTVLNDACAIHALTVTDEIRNEITDRALRGRIWIGEGEE